MTEIFPATDPEAQRVSRRRLVRRAILLIVLAGFIPTIMRAWPKFSDRIRTRMAMQAAQRECMRVNRSSERVVYDDDPEAMKVLWASRDPKYAFCQYPSPPPRRAVVELVGPWQRMFKLVNPASNGLPVALFIHARSVAASERLVVVDMDDRIEVAPDRFLLHIGAIVVPPINALLAPGIESRRYVIDFNARSIRFFAGQNDPADSSHLTIRYIVGNEEGELDGRLRQGDKLDLKITRGPGAMRLDPSSP